MNVKEFMEIVDEGKEYWEQIEVYVNGKPADDISFGLVAGTNQMIINIESYDPD